MTRSADITRGVGASDAACRSRCSSYTLPPVLRTVVTPADTFTSLGRGLAVTLYVNNCVAPNYDICLAHFSGANIYNIPVSEYHTSVQQ